MTQMKTPQRHPHSKLTTQGSLLEDTTYHSSDTSFLFIFYFLLLLSKTVMYYLNTIKLYILKKKKKKKDRFNLKLLYVYQFNCVPTIMALVNFNIFSIEVSVFYNKETLLYINLQYSFAN